jgi:hypothetical protein
VSGWQHPDAARRGESVVDSGASAGFGGRCGLLQSSRTFGYGESGGSPKRIVAERRAAPQRAVWQRAGPTPCFFGTWSPFNGGVESLSVATSATRTVGKSVRTARIASCVRGRRGRGELLGARTIAFDPAVPALRCREGGHRASGGRERGRLVAPGGFQSAARVFFDPTRAGSEVDPDRGASPAKGTRRGWHAEDATEDARHRARLGFVRSLQGSGIRDVSGAGNGGGPRSTMTIFPSGAVRSQR